MVLEFSWPENDHEFTGISFVFCNKSSNQWFNNSNKNFHIGFFGQEAKQENPSEIGLEGQIGKVVSDIIMCEVEYGSWTLMHRYQKAKEFLCNGMVDTANKNEVAYIYIWLRFSALR